MNKTAIEANALRVEWVKRHHGKRCSHKTYGVRVDPITNYFYTIPDTEKRCPGLIQVKMNVSQRWEAVNTATPGLPKVMGHKEVKRYQVWQTCSVCENGYASHWFIEPFKSYWDDEDIPF